MNTFKFLTEISQKNHKHLVISFGVGYKTEILEPFLRSLYAYCPNIPIVMVVGQADHNFENTLKKFNKNIILMTLTSNQIIIIISAIPGFKKLWRFGTKALTTISWKHGNTLLSKLSQSISALGEGRYITPIVTIALARYYISREILEKNFQEAASILLTDSRDVFFQGNPFENLEENLVSGLEDKTIKQSVHNSKWINHLYGKKGLARIGDYPIICAGVTIGRRNAILDYLNEMCNEISIHLLKCAFMGGLDQGFHNWIIREKGAVEISLVPNGGNMIATLGFSRLGTFEFDEKKGLINLKNELVKIVHQYDRKDFLKAWCQNKWTGESI